MDRRNPTNWVSETKTQILHVPRFQVPDQGRAAWNSYSPAGWQHMPPIAKRQFDKKHLPAQSPGILRLPVPHWLWRSPPPPMPDWHPGDACQQSDPGIPPGRLGYGKRVLRNCFRSVKITMETQQSTQAPPQRFNMDSDDISILDRFQIQSSVALKMSWVKVRTLV